MYYVYGHYQYDTGDVFYIGKGKGTRLDSKDGRNAWWHTEATKEKMRIKKLKNTFGRGGKGKKSPQKGTKRGPFNDRWRANMREAAKNRPQVSLETRQRMSAAQLNRYNPINNISTSTGVLPWT
jgi:hypothetical protein